MNVFNKERDWMGQALEKIREAADAGDAAARAAISRMERHSGSVVRGLEAVGKAHEEANKKGVENWKKYRDAVEDAALGFVPLLAQYRRLWEYGEKPLRAFTDIVFDKDSVAQMNKSLQDMAAEARRTFEQEMTFKKGTEDAIGGVLKAMADGDEAVQKAITNLFRVVHAQARFEENLVAVADAGYTKLAERLRELAKTDPAAAVWAAMIAGGDAAAIKAARAIEATLSGFRMDQAAIENMRTQLAALGTESYKAWLAAWLAEQKNNPLTITPPTMPGAPGGTRPGAQTAATIVVEVDGRQLFTAMREHAVK
jgi:hypothetical protein